MTIGAAIAMWFVVMFVLSVVVTWAVHYWDNRHDKELQAIIDGLHIMLYSDASRPVEDMKAKGATK